MLPLAEQIVDVVCPDVKNEVDDMDIRQYVQFKKVPGGGRESRIVSGVVCTKNVAHRAMATRLVNPRILLLGCSIAYQRVEGKLLSLEPVMMQEYEYLRNVVTRIANLQPNLVLVQRNVSRLAQEFLLGLQVTLVLNIKASVLERVSRCTQADIVTSVDAHIGRPRLGTCQMFHLETFNTERGCTVLLRGASNTELAKLKRVATRMIFIEYSWRLEKSFLMDESARPPSPPSDTFFEDHVSNDAANNLDQHSNILPFTPVKPETTLNSCSDADLKCHSDNGETQFQRQEEICKCKITKFQTSSKDKSSLSEEKRMNVESVSDFSDPLHLYLSLDDDVFSAGQQSGQQLSVAELPLSNHFRKALDETILSASPFLKFTVPYLETEAGRNCVLRRFFPDEIFWSAQFNSSSDTNTNSRANNGMEMAMQLDNKVN
ncbi:unnamed protein product [Timema podura]|uniref:Uncharacterized protein n=1 Tax=Timema podura TaxID=61482 RepID=A0ABN7P9B3_TIMPD|nr:unnamed protein product [Timema podura]